MGFWRWVCLCARMCGLGRDDRSLGSCGRPPLGRPGLEGEAWAAPQAGLSFLPCWWRVALVLRTWSPIPQWVCPVSQTVECGGPGEHGDLALQGREERVAGQPEGPQGSPATTGPLPAASCPWPWGAGGVRMGAGPLRVLGGPQSQLSLWASEEAEEGGSASCLHGPQEVPPRGQCGTETPGDSADPPTPVV